MVRSKPSSTGRRRSRIGEGDVAERGSRGAAGRCGRGVPATGSAPAAAIAGSRREHRGHRGGGAVERPVQPAERDHARADGAPARRSRATGRSRPPVDRGAGQRPEHQRRWRRARAAGAAAPTARAAGSPAYCSSWRLAPALGEPVEHPAGQPEQPHLLGRRRVDGEAGRRSRRGAAAARTSSVLRSRQTPLSRSSQWVRAQAPASSERRPPGEAERARAPRRCPPSSIDQPAGDEVHVHEHRRAGHAEVEVAGRGEVLGQLAVLEVADAGRADARSR